MLVRFIKFLRTALKTFIELNFVIFITTGLILTLGINGLYIGPQPELEFLLRLLIIFLQEMDLDPKVWKMPPFLIDLTEIALHVWHSYLTLFYHLEPYTNVITKPIANNVRWFCHYQLKLEELDIQVILHRFTLLGACQVMAYWSEAFSTYFNIGPKAGRMFTPKVIRFVYIYNIIILTVDISLLIH